MKIPHTNGAIKTFPEPFAPLPRDRPRSDIFAAARLDSCPLARAKALQARRWTK